MGAKKLKARPRIRVYKENVLDEKLTGFAQRASDKVTKNWGLSYPDIDFHFVDLDELSSILATHGWILYPQHWSHGQSYYIIKKQHELYQGGVAELVVNSGVFDDKRKEPINAYIYSLDDEILRKLVTVHVFGHAHMYHNNKRISESKPDSPLAMMNEHAQTVYDIERDVGRERVEEFLDALYSLSTLVDVYPDKTKEEKLKKQEKLALERDAAEKIIEPVEERRKRLLKKMSERGKDVPVPEFREYDIMRFLEKHARLNEWERKLVKVVGDQSRFIYGGSLCKILHEGFADLVEWRYAMERDNELNLGETFSWFKHHGSTQLHNPEGIIREGFNPYALGFTMLRHVMEKYGDERFGIKYDSDPYAGRRDIRKGLLDLNWDKGWKKVLEIIETNTDYTFINTYFTPEFYNEYGDVFFVYEGEGYEDIKKIVTSRDFVDIKNTFLFETFNFKLPRVYVKPGGANHDNKDELYLVQDIENFERIGIKPQQLTLNPKKTRSVLKSLYRVWKRPVNLETIDVVYLDDGENDQYWTTYWWSFIFSWLYPGAWPTDEVLEIKEIPAKVHKIVARYDGKEYTEKHINPEEEKEHKNDEVYE